MKTVIHRERFSAPGDIHDFPDAGIKVKNGEPTVVTDEQAAILLTNPDVSLVADKPEPAAIVDAKPAVKAAVAAAKASVTEAA